MVRANVNITLDLHEVLQAKLVDEAELAMITGIKLIECTCVIAAGAVVSGGVVKFPYNPRLPSKIWKEPSSSGNSRPGRDLLGRSRAALQRG